MTQTREYGRRVQQTPPDYSLCAGCNSCEVICCLVHGGAVSPSRRRLTVRRDIRTMMHTVYSCQHCADHPCYDKCPKKGTAMKLTPDGVAYIDESECIGCGLCHKACVFDPPRINYVKSAPKETRRARKCDMCFERPEGPACVQWCPVRCLFVE
ncbi:MAG: 4Fe-4S binding protein [Oscillospiraceae bacterium]|jgi:Fe-S-cluster-containing dehydrogenase component|nr:4Fe-4S binding protein [Oscillospiraceae bacterium]